MKNLILLCKKYLPYFRCEFDGDLLDLYFVQSASVLTTIISSHRDTGEVVRGVSETEAREVMLRRLRRVRDEHMDMAKEHAATALEIDGEITSA